MNNKTIIDKLLRSIFINKDTLINNFNLIKTNYKSTHEKLINNLKLFKVNLLLFNKKNNKFFGYINFNNNNNNNKNRNRFLFTSYCTVAFYNNKFSWDDYRVTNDELKNYVCEILDEFGKSKQHPDLNHSLTESKKSDNNNNVIDIDDNSWEKIFSRHDLIIWRRKLIELDDDNENVNDNNLNKNSNKQQSGIWEYKVFGRLYDVSAIDFFRTQIDLDYRKKWDHLVIKLQVMSTDKKYKNQTSELIQWIMKYPFPMNSREYIFVRRYCIEPEKSLLILVSKSIKNPNISIVDNDDENGFTNTTFINHNISNEDDKQKKLLNNQYQDVEKKKSQQNVYEQPHQQAPYVRVTKYKSNMIIIPHKSNEFNELGLDFYLHYYDDPKARIPNMAYKWMATSGLPDWLDKLHKAAKGVPKPDKDINLLEKYELFYLEDKKDEPPLQPPPPPPPPSSDESPTIESSQVEEIKKQVTTPETTTISQKNISKHAKKEKQNNEKITKFIFFHNFDSEPHPSFY